MYRALQTWLESSFRNRLLGTILAANLGVLLLITLLGYGALVVNIKDRFATESELALKISGEHVQGALEATVRDLERLARFPLVVNALTDTEERQLYLNPTLEDATRRSRALTFITLLDHRASALVARVPESVSSSSRDIALATMKSRYGHAIVLGEPDKPMIRIALPVIYPPTGSAEGVILAQIDVTSLLPSESGTASTEISFEHGPALPESTSTTLGADRYLMLALPANISPEANLWVHARLNENLVSGTVSRASLAFVLCALFLLAFSFVISRRLATVLSKPVESLAMTVADPLMLDDRGPLPATLEGAPIELRRLSEAFSELVIELRTRNRAMSVHASAQSAHALRREHQLSAVLNLGRDGYAVIGSGGVVEYINPSFEHMTGVDSWRIIGRKSDTLLTELRSRLVPSSPWPAPLANITGNARATPAEGEQDDCILEMAPPLSSSLKATVWRSDALVGAYVIQLRDVTKELALDRMKSQFLTSAAHELRTPVSTIYGFAQVLREQGKASAPGTLTEEAIRSICQQCEMLSQMLDDLLDLETLEELRASEAGPQARVNVHELIQLATGSFHVPERRTPVQVDVSGNEIWTRGDREQLRNAICNLLSNAYKYSTEDTEVSIYISTDGTTMPRGKAPKTARPMIGICVRDHGIGMTQLECEHAFTRFWRADTVGSTPGTGLGLSLVKDIAGLHNGAVELRSGPGVGTIAVLWLPRDLPASS